MQHGGLWKKEEKKNKNGDSEKWRNEGGSLGGIKGPILNKFTLPVFPNNNP